jgi:uncharacterized membrane protein YccC
MNATFPDLQSAQLGWLDWLRRELSPSHDRRVRTLILICGAVLCVIISMALQVPELSISAYMIFFISKENKTLTTMVGVLGLIGLTIGIAVSLLLYKLTYGHPELRIPSMAIVLFLGMYLSRALVLGPLAFLLGFVIAATQSIGDLLPTPELMLREILWIWVALAYAVGLTVVLNGLFLPKPKGPPKPLPRGPFVPDAFTNPAHVRFALKVTFAAMFCYVLYSGIDWFGIHTAFITCVFIALESTGRTLHKGVLRAVGCIIGGLLALFSIVFLIPHMQTIASLVVLVACVSAIAGWVATGTERIAYAGLQIALAFFYGLFPGIQGFAPSTDLHELRDRFVGILLGLFVTAVVFQYIWPERAIDRLRDTLREVLQQLAKLLVIPSPQTPVKEAKAKAEAFITEISRELEQARREAELTSFEIDEPRTREGVSLGSLETILSRAERVLALATSLTSDSAWQEWQQLPPEAQAAETELRNAVARRVERAVNGDSVVDADANLSIAVARWTETIHRLSPEGGRIALVSQIAAEAQHLG